MRMGVHYPQLNTHDPSDKVPFKKHAIFDMRHPSKDDRSSKLFRSFDACKEETSARVFLEKCVVRLDYPSEGDWLPMCANLCR